MRGIWVVWGTWWRARLGDEAGSIPEWVMLLVMAVGVILAIMVFFGDSIAGIVQDQLRDVTSGRPRP